MDSLDGTVDISGKGTSLRRAVAQSTVVCTAEAIRAIEDNRLPKKDPVGTARAAGMLAVKETSRLIPHCHPIAITGITFGFEFARDSVTVRCEVLARDRTGPEMEALVGAAVAALTLYDMIKGISKGASITGTFLVEKDGGESGHWRRGAPDG